VAVLEGGFVAPGGANSIGATTPLEVPLVERLKYFNNICGEIMGSGAMDVEAGRGMLAAAGGLVSTMGAGGGAIALSSSADGAGGP
jgi:hypothetical protein